VPLPPSSTLFPYTTLFRSKDAGTKYANDVKEVIDFATPGKVAGFIAESIQGVGGFVEFPEGYLKGVYEHVRAAGGVCIADEVQTDRKSTRLNSSHLPISEA